MSDWSMKSFNIPSDNSSYFDKVNKEKLDQAREQIIHEVRLEADRAIHNIVTGKDAEIEILKSAVKKLEEQKTILEDEIHKASNNVAPAGEVKDLTDFDIINNALVKGLKYGEKTKDVLNNEQLEKIRDVIILWKEFLEEYKWKSNYISNKIKKLLKDTNDIL